MAVSYKCCALPLSYRGNLEVWLMFGNWKHRFYYFALRPGFPGEQVMTTTSGALNCGLKAALHRLERIEKESG
jgi:hypothetical protein